ncbi:MAG: DUF1553 domain-containing protein [Planctomycetota bacterium]
MSVRAGNNVLLLLVTAVCLGGAVVLPVRSPPPAPVLAQDAAQDGTALFRDEVLPLLEAQCFECHGPEKAKPKGRLRMSGRDALLEGGSSGPAVVPGDAEGSLLLTAVRYTDPDLQMPPENRLTPEQVELLARWVSEGAIWPADEAADGDARADSGAAAGGGAAAGRGGGGARVDAVTPHAPDAGPSGASDLGAEPTEEQARHFEERIRPLLSENCFRCHGPDAKKLKAGLLMSGRSGLLAGGDSGPAIVPGDPDKSLLVQAVRYDDSELQMPPDGRLPDASIALLEDWVRDGAPWPGYEDVASRPADERDIDVEAGRDWWSFRPVVRPEVPSSAFDARAANDIDRFVFARLEAAGLAPSPLADPAVLVRRLSFDLLGLPPREEDVAAYASDPSPAAWATLVDAMLARPEYGERWARHWLDVVRYAQTNGYERDAEKPYAWRFRDYVIDAFNEDKPWNRFVMEQLAGDELDEVTDESLIATGFYRLGVWDDEPDDPAQARYDELDDTVRTIGEGFLGVTLACARCHDHKFDPFRQMDYYGALAFVQNVSRYKAPKFSLQSPTLTPLDLDWNTSAVWERERNEFIAALKKEKADLLEKGRELAMEAALLDLSPDARAALDTPPAERTPGQKTLVAALRAKEISEVEARQALPRDDRKRVAGIPTEIQETLTSFEGSLRWALTVKEDGPWRPSTHLLIRGSAAAKGPRVEPTFPAVLAASDARAIPALPTPTPAERRNSLGRRRALAEWIVSPENPLTARVIVNRVWQHHFGRGIVPSPNNFGAAGERPSHPELLDWLADEFVRGGWSMKRLHRLILSTHAWRQASTVHDAAVTERAQEVDPGNALLWRQNLRRLEAESLRDSVLSVSGRLSDERGGRGYFAALSREVLAGGSRPGEGWQPDEDAARDRRSIYAYVKRNLADPLIDSFDGPATSLPVAARATTTVPSQALVLLNGDFLNEQASAFAERVVREAGEDPGARVEHAYRLALQRPPGSSERGLALAYLENLGTELLQRPPVQVFRASMPPRVDTAFLAQLSGRDILHAPPGDWELTRGVWGAEYNSTRELFTARGPVAFVPGHAVTDVTLDARVQLPHTPGVAGLLVRGEPVDDDVESLELLLDREEGAVRLVHHHADAIDVLAEAELALPAGTWLDVRIEAQGDRVKVSLGVLDAAEHELVLDADVSGLLPEGRPGVRAWGEGITLDTLAITTSDGTRRLRADNPGPARRALESFCLLLFNLNEFAYVD